MNPILTARRGRRAGPTPGLPRAVLRLGATGQPQNPGTSHANQPRPQAPHVPPLQGTGQPKLVDYPNTLTAPGQNGGQPR